MTWRDTALRRIQGKPGAFFPVVGTFLVIVAGFWLFTSARFAFNHQMTTGRVTYSYSTAPSKNGVPQPVCEYVFQVGGQHFDGHGYVSGNPGDPILIDYRPADPADNRPTNENHESIWPFAGILMLLGLVCLGAGIRQFNANADLLSD